MHISAECPAGQFGADDVRGRQQDRYRQFLRGFPHRPDDRACDAAHHHGGRCGALHRPVRASLCGAVLGRLCASHRLSARAGRRPPRLPRRVRQDRAGYLAQRRRQSRLCRLPLPRAGLSRRHAQCGVRGDRAEGEFEPQDRHRVRALDRIQAGRQQGAGICALGDGAEARRGSAGGRRSRAAPARRGAAEHARAMPARASMSRPTTSRSPAAPIASTTTPWARRSTTSTA